MRTIAIGIIGLTIAFAAYFFATPTSYDDPRPVAMGETAVQLIRDEEGDLQRWTYTREALPEAQVMAAPESAPTPPTGAARILNEQALNAWNTGDIAASLELFDEAIAADPNDPEPHSNYGRRLTLMVANDKALPLLLRAGELKPDDPQIWLDLLTLYEKTLQFQKANAARRRAQELAGDRAFVRNQQGAWLLEGINLP